MNGLPFRELHLFAGAGGGVLGGILCGHVPVCAVELEEYPRAVLLQRQRDGILPWFPVWDDARTFDGRPWRGHVDIIENLECLPKSEHTRKYSPHNNQYTKGRKAKG